MTSDALLEAACVCVVDPNPDEITAALGPACIDQDGFGRDLGESCGVF